MTPKKFTKPAESLDVATAANVSPRQWREWNATERVHFNEHERQRGCASFRCLSCGYPVGRGVMGCESCGPSETDPANQYWAPEDR